MVERRIFAISLLDGTQVTALIVVLPFVLFSGAENSSTAFLKATPIAMVFGLGILGTFIVGQQVDRRSPVVILQMLQLAQVIFLVATIGAALFERYQIVGTFAMLSLAVSRSVGPAKDKLRSLFIEEERRTQFNAHVRRYFLVVNELTAALCVVVIAFVSVYY